MLYNYNKLKDVGVCFMVLYFISLFLRPCSGLL